MTATGLYTRPAAPVLPDTEGRCDADGIAAATWAVQIPKGPRNPAAVLRFCDHHMREHVTALAAADYLVDAVTP